MNYGYVEEMGRYNITSRKSQVEKASTKREGWVAKALVEYALDWGIPGVFGWYGSGDDGSLKNGSERMPSDAFPQKSPQAAGMTRRARNGFGRDFYKKLQKNKKNNTPHILILQCPASVTTSKKNHIQAFMKEYPMSKIVGSVLLSMLLAVPAVPLMTSEAQAVPTDRKEVEHRLELNNVTAEELAATGAVDLETAKKIVQLREDLGGFQSYDDLKELNLPEEQFKQLQYNTTIKGIAADCNC